MADRLSNGYPGFSQNFNQGLSSQQSQGQPSQQSQVGPPGAIGGLSDPDQARAWQQYSQQHRNTSGGDMMGNSGMTPQMAELMRSSQMGHMNASPMGQPQQPLQPPFVMKPGALQPSPSQGFQEQNMHPQMQSGFPNGALNNSSLQQQMGAISALNAQRNASNRPLFTALQAASPSNPSVHSRQLELIGMAHNQQSSQLNGPLNNLARMQQLQQAQSGMGALQPGQAPQQIQGMFSQSASSGIRGEHTSPVPNPARLGAPSLQPQQMTMQQMLQTAQMLRTAIATGEQQIMSLRSNAAGTSEVTTNKAMQETRKKVDEHKMILARIITTVNQKRQTMGIAPMPLEASSGMPPKLLKNGATNPEWLVANGHQPDLFTKQGVAAQRNSPSLHPQLPQPPSQRTIPTPQQHLMGSGGPSQSNMPHMSPHISNGSPFNGALYPQGTGTPPQSSPRLPQPQAVQPTQPNQPLVNTGQFAPLNQERFLTLWRSYAQQHNVNIDQQWLYYEGRQINLHALHYNVFGSGGYNQVHTNDLWAAIGGRMGFVHFPASDSEPAKAAPALAQRLQMLYSEYIAGFDHAYVSMMVGAQQRAANNNAQGTQGVHHPQQPTGAPQPGTLRQITPQAMNQVVHYAHTSEAEMRSRGVPDHIIRFVEANRPQLERQLQSQNMFRGALAKNAQANGSGGMPGQNAPSAQTMGQHLAQQQQQADQQQQQQLQQQQLQYEQRRQMALNPGASPYLSGQVPPRAGAAQQNASSMGMQMGAGMGGAPGQNLQSMLPGGSGMNGGPLAANVQHANRSGPLQGQGQRLPTFSPTPPTHDAIAKAVEFISEYRKGWTSMQDLNQVPEHTVPDNQRASYNEALERLITQLTDLEKRLPVYHAVVRNEDIVKKLLMISVTARYQQQQLTTGKPRFILELNTVRSMYQQVSNANAGFKNAMTAAVSAHARSTGGGMPGSSVPSQPPQPPQPPSQSLAHPPQHNPAHQQPLPPPVPPASVRQGPPPSSSSHKKKSSQAQIQGPVNVAASVSTPTPPPPSQTASTPSAQASTPSVPAPSPQTPKSPKVKNASKAKTAQPRRKASKATPANTESQPGPSTSVTTSSPTTASPDVKTTPKRAREEDVQIVDGPASAPSPKRAKPDWDGPPSEALQKRQEEVDNIKTDEEATRFVERMTELLKMANDGQDPAITANITESLEAILAGYPVDINDPSLSSSFGLSAAFGDPMQPPLSPPSAHMPANDPLVEFFDFTSYAMDDDPTGSKAPTPDLVAGSSTNPSPKSASDDASGHPGSHANSSPQIANAKTDDLGEDPLALGIWREVDGGESAYYQQPGWKWDAPMPALDQPWAITMTSQS